MINKLINNTFYRMNKAEDKARAYYRKLLNMLEKLFLQNKTEKDIMDKFHAEILKEFKIIVVFDAVMSEALKEYYKEQSQHLGTQTYTNKINFIDKINYLLYKIEFISFKSFSKLADIIKKQKNSQENVWQSGLAYLRKCSCKNQFRSDFLSIYCQLDQGQMKQFFNEDDQFIQQSLQKVKAHYENFFKKKCWQANVSNRLIMFIQSQFSNFENKSEMLSLETIKQLDKKLGGSVGGSNQQVNLNTVLIDIAQRNAYVNDHQASQRLEGQIQNIQKALRKFSGLTPFKQKGIVLRLAKFGSLISGFAGTDADLDLTILTNSYIEQNEFLTILADFLRRQFKQQQRNAGRRLKVDTILNAKTPLVQIIVIQRGKQDLKIDLILNNILGVVNSKFLNVYSRVRWVKNLGLLVKMWGKSIQLIGKNALSSYAMIIMLIHYLIKDKKVKALMDHRIPTPDMAHFDYKRKKSNIDQQFKVYYEFKTQQKDVTPYQRINYRKVLMGFMKYYAQELWEIKNQEERVISVDMGSRPVDSECVITIKDPFDEPHNPGRLKIEQSDFFKQKFKEAYTILEKGEQSRIKSLFK